MTTARQLANATNNLAGQAFIEGLIPVWNSANSISVGPGSAYVPGSNKNLVVGATLTISSFVSVASTWYYLYLYDNAGTPAIELVTTAPSAPYVGSARTKTGDTSRRFLCAMRAVATNSLAKFLVDNTGILNYVNANQGTPYRILSGGAATSNTVIDASSMVPPTTRLGKFQLFNLGTITAVFYPADAPSLNYGNMGAGNRESGALLPLDAAQRLGYYNDGSSGGLFYVDVQGYGMDR